jgi:hypothetical protein
MNIAALYFLLVFFAVVLQILAVGTSILTIREMILTYKKPLTEAARKKSVCVSLKILITNFGSLINIVFYGVKAYISTFVMSVEVSTEEHFIKVKEEIPWFFIFIIFYSAIVPVVLSTLNPVIYIAFTPGTAQVRKVKKTLHDVALCETENVSRV